MNYQSVKSVKLSDAYVVEIQDFDENAAGNKFRINGIEDSSVLDEPEGRVNCCLNNVVNVKIPNIKTLTDQLKYNTFSHGFIKIDMDSTPETLDITLYETSDEKVKKLINYLLEKNGYNERSFGAFAPFRALSKLKVYILNNNLTKSVFSYEFTDLKLLNYDYSYSYDYKASDLPQVTLSFGYGGYSFGPDDSFKLESTKTAMKYEQNQKDYMPNPTPKYEHGGKYR